MPKPADVAARLIPRLEARRFSGAFAATGAEAKEALLSRIPHGSAVMAASSTTLDQIGVTQALTTGPWDYLRAKIWAENDPAKRHELRARAALAPFFLGSVPAITEDGILVAADNSGSRVSGYMFGPENVIIAASTNKVVPDLAAAMRRIREVAAPLEQDRVNKSAMKYESRPNKWALLEGEPKAGRLHVVLIGEPYGF